jgi:excisionase family DNA binding protein
MNELLTTEEAAAYLRLSERKLYELVAHGAVPCTKTTGRWLFPKAALDRWLDAGLTRPPGFSDTTAPPTLPISAPWSSAAPASPCGRKGRGLISCSWRCCGALAWSPQH